MIMEQQTKVEDGITFFYVTWKCCDMSWEKKIKWDNLEELGKWPRCPRCLDNGALFLS